MNENTNSQLVDVTMPRLGETVVEGTIIRWFKEVGDDISADEPLFEVSTDKVDTEVPSPTSGVLMEILAEQDDVVEVGTVVARISDSAVAEVDTSADGSTDDTSVTEASSSDPSTTSASATRVSATRVSATRVSATESSSEDVSSSAEDSGVSTADRAGVALIMSPLVRRLIAENNLDPNSIKPTGIGGRITRADVEKEIKSRAGKAGRAKEFLLQSSDAESAHGPAGVAITPQQPPQPVPEEMPASASGRGYQSVSLNKVRLLTAEHMVMSKKVSPHVLTAIEVDYEAVERARLPARADWKEEEGFSLTYLPFIARAVIDALREHPYLNASFGDNELILHQYVNLAIAVDINFEGLLAPVIHRAESKRLRHLARDIVDVATRARNRKLTPDDLSSGTFTITNAGRYGTLLQFPIINQPQVAILSTEGISRKPVVVTDGHGEEAIAIRSVGVLSMAWDHRAFDGAYAASFLNRVKQIIETRVWEQELG